jgi:hypothetical protein
LRYHIATRKVLDIAEQWRIRNFVLGDVRRVRYAAKCQQQDEKNRYSIHGL